MADSKPVRSPGCLKAVGLVALLIGLGVAGLIYWIAPYGPDHLEVVIPLGQPVVDAVEAYQKKNGRLPDRLEELVPEFLSGVLQADSIPGCRSFAYRKRSEKDLERYEIRLLMHHREQIWYDSTGKYTEDWGTFEKLKGWAYTRD